MVNVLYPARQRCRACRRFFGAIVIRGQWCSYHCAGMDVPSDSPADWPRQHYTRYSVSAGKSVKRAYNSEGEAVAAFPEDRPFNAYLCGYCGMYHMGRNNAGQGY